MAVARLSLFFGLALAACSGAGSPSAAPASTPPAAVLSTSGSTDTEPYTFVIQFDGDVTITQDGQTRTGVATESSTSQFYTDINANLPVASISAGADCAKSASFGTTTTITYEASTSADVSCPNSSAAKQIWNDIEVLEGQFAPYSDSTITPAARTR